MSDPRQEIMEAIEAADRAVQAQAASRFRPMSERMNAAAALRAAWGHLKEVRELERERFAESRGWRVYNGTQDWIYTGQLIAGRMLNSVRDVEDEHRYVIDHNRDSFVGWVGDGRRTVKSCRYPAAILAHTDGEWDRCVGFAQRHSLNVERLDWSWHHPTRCIAALFTRREP